MTTSTIINHISTHHRTDVSESVMLSLLFELDTQIWQSVISTHEGGCPAPEPYTLSSELLLPGEYADVYRHYLAARVYLLSGVPAKYETYSALYSTAYAEWSRQYNRAHRYKERKLKLS